MYSSKKRTIRKRNCILSPLTFTFLFLKTIRFYIKNRNPSSITCSSHCYGLNLSTMHVLKPFSESKHYYWSWCPHERDAWSRPSPETNPGVLILDSYDLELKNNNSNNKKTCVAKSCPVEQIWYLQTRFMRASILLKMSKSYTLNSGTTFQVPFAD